MLTRRRLLGLSTMALGLAAASVTGCDGTTGVSGTPTPAGGVTAPPPAGVLGANVNQNLADTNFAELRAVSATWLRGFYLMQLADQGRVADQPEMRTLISAVDQGYGTVLNLKFDYEQGLPTAGSSAMNLALRRLDQVLAVVMGKVDIIVVGNEPFYECGQHDKTNPVINEFYEALAQYTINYRQQHTAQGKTQIYLGALTDLEDPASRTPQTDRWLEFTKNTPGIAGTDCHPHVASLADAQQYPAYILPRLRSDQAFLATEFSLVKLYRSHLGDPVASTFASHRGIRQGTPVWQVIKDSLQRPFPQAEWNRFLASCPWFANNQRFMTDAVGAFRGTGRCAVAAYGLTQDAAMSTGFGPNSTPWVLNSLFCPHTVQSATDGLPGQNLVWTSEFRALQHR